MKNITVSFLFLTILTIMSSCGKVKIYKEPLTNSLPYNDSVTVIFSEGYKSDVLMISGKPKRIITTNESSGIAFDCYVTCRDLSEARILVNNDLIGIQDFDCRYSQIVIRKQFMGYQVDYFVEERTFD